MLMLSEVLIRGTVAVDFPSDWKKELKRGRRLALKHYTLLIFPLQMLDIDIIFFFFPQFFSKLEEKVLAKEAEKTNQQEKSKVYHH